MIRIRHAEESDAEAIRNIFQTVYGDDYFHPEFYDLNSLKRMIFNEETALLVAEETETGELLGTASVLLDIGAHADLVAEFGRLAVHPKGRGQGIGQQLMEARVREVENRLHVGLVENRCAHEFSQRISYRHGFRPVGLLPIKYRLSERESVALYARHFGHALELRRNHPRIIPEAYLLAEFALKNCEIPCDVIVDAESLAYPHVEDFELQEMTSELYPALLRFERGRVKRREIFGPMRLHYGLFQLRASRGQYLLAYRDGVMIGAVGFAVDEHEQTGKIFELVSLDDTPIHFLLKQLVSRCREQYGVEYLEADVSAFSLPMQRTLLELGFLPAAYIPAMVFHDVERLDIIRMVLLLTTWDSSCLCLFEATQPIARVVEESFRLKLALPRLIAAVAEAPLFAGLTAEQQHCIASVAALESLTADEILFRPDDPEDRAWVILSGTVEVQGPQEEPLGIIGQNESLGEMMAISDQFHRVTARVREGGEAMVLSRDVMQGLIRKRPDIGMILYRNLCRELAEKLQRMNLKAPQSPPGVMETN